MKIIVFKHPESNDVGIVLAKVVYSCDLLISYEQDGHKNHISLCYMKLLNINDGPQNINEYKKYILKSCLMILRMRIQVILLLQVFDYR